MGMVRDSFYLRRHVPKPCLSGDGVVTGGRMAEREGTAASGPERPRRGETHCLSPQGELCVSSAGPDKLRSSAELATARHRPCIHP